MLNKSHDKRLAEARDSSSACVRISGIAFLKATGDWAIRDTALSQKTSCLVDNRRLLLDQKFAHAVRCLHVLLFNRLHGNKVHDRRDAASTIASASLRSFLFVLTKGEA
jgi:hypothetical protein